MGFGRSLPLQGKEAVEKALRSSPNRRLDKVCSGRSHRKVDIPESEKYVIINVHFTMPWSDIYSFVQFVCLFVRLFVRSFE